MAGKILFRADGNANIGAGHVMRCMAIGITAKRMGIDCLFVTADESFVEKLHSNDFRVNVMNTDYMKMDEELYIFESLLLQEKPDIVIVDSYYVTDSYLTKVKSFVKTVYIDDVMTFQYPVDIVINYNVYAHKLGYEEFYGERHPRMLLGSKYVPLRDEFQSGQVIDIKEKVSNVLFSAGGADPERIALRFIKRVVSDGRFDQYDFHIVMGSFEPDKEEIERIGQNCGNIHTYSDVKRMSDLMRTCDIAISAAGSTLYELCACGVPTITYVLADNQENGAKTFDEMGAMINAGDNRTCIDLMDKIVDSVLDITTDYHRRMEMQHNARECVDGEGAKRIVLYIMSQIKKA